MAALAHHVWLRVAGTAQTGIGLRILPHAVHQRIDAGARTRGGPAHPRSRETAMSAESSAGACTGACVSVQALQPIPSAQSPAGLGGPGLAPVRAYVRASKADNTLRGYQSDWRDFCAWCESRGGLCPLPAAADTVAAYIAECAQHLKPGSIQRRLNAIAEAHKAAGLDSPTHAAIVRNTLKGIRRTLGTAPAQKAPALTDDIRAMVDATDAEIIGARDRALVLLGFAGAFRRSELVGLNVEDCAFGKDGLTVMLRRSKTDQEGAGRKVGIPYGSNPETCPVRTMQGWIGQTGITSGPLFRPINRHGH